MKLFVFACVRARFMRARRKEAGNDDFMKLEAYPFLRIGELNTRISLAQLPISNL